MVSKRVVYVTRPTTPHALTSPSKTYSAGKYAAQKIKMNFYCYIGIEVKLEALSIKLQNPFLLS